MQNEDKEVSLLALTTKLLLSNLNILLKLTHSVLQSCTGIIDLIDNENVLANQVGHLERAHIQPLCAGDLGTGDLLGITTTQVFIEGETNSLNGDVGVTGALEEGAAGNQYMLCMSTCYARERTGGCGQERNHHHQWRS